MRFPSAKSWFVGIVIWGAVVLIIFEGILAVQEGGTEQWMIIILALVAAMILWMWFATYYKINDNQLQYRSGPLHGTISISSIRIITTGKNQFVGLKPALASNGCVVEYEKYNEIYVSPKDKDGFVAALLKINSAIEIIANK